MKPSFALLLGIFLAALSCEEIPPIITPISPTEATETTRQVLIEEFTGVRCVNCPAGSQAIEDLINIYGDRLVVVSIHSGSFANPYPDSQIDFRMPDGEALLNFIGKPLGYPTASINRKIFTGERDLQLEGRNSWAGFVAQELETEAKVRMDLQTNLNPDSRSLTIDITTTIEEEIEAENLRITALIIENNVQDTQLTPDGIQNDYTHQHVLRQVLTNSNGNLITEDFSVGSSFTLTLSEELGSEIDLEEAKVIAFISLSDESKEVLQSIQKSL